MLAGSTIGRPAQAVPAPKASGSLRRSRRRLAPPPKVLELWMTLRPALGATGSTTPGIENFQATINDPNGDALRLAARVAAAACDELVDEINEKLVGESAQKLVDIQQELEARVAAAEKSVAAAEASVAAEGRRRDDEAMKTGKDIASLRVELSDKVAALRDRIANTVEKLPPAVDPAQVNRIVGAAVAGACSDLRSELRSEFAAERRDLVLQIATLEKRLNEATGELPQVRNWKPGTVFYRGQFATFNGALFQARRDCATRPDVGDDWTQVAAAGRDGADGRSARMRGLYNTTRSYERLDVVLFGGEAFMAKVDGPGLCPSDGWVRLAQRGAKGAKGERGARGPRGEKGPATQPLRIHSWLIEPAHYRASPLMTDGTTGPPLPLRSLFERFLAETSDGST